MILYHPTVDRYTYQEWTKPKSCAVDAYLVQIDRLQIKKASPKAYPQ